MDMGQQGRVASGGVVGARLPVVARVAPWAVPAWRTEALLLGLTLALAGLVRWPYLLEWPAFTDESREVLLSLAVARGERWPWTNVNTYIGPWHVYLLAGAFKLAGTSIWVPRALMLALNLAAVGLTYLLARRLAGRLAGLVAGLLVALSPMWVLVNSHVAWSAGTTPLYALAALVLAHRALAGAAAVPPLRRSAAPLLLPAGLLLGIAGQTHPSGLLLAPALALATVWGRAGWRRLRTPWPWLALAAALLGYAPVLLYNTVVAPGASLAEAERIGGARGLTATPLAIVARAPGMWWNELRMVAGVSEPWVLPAWSQPLVAAATLLLLGLAGWGLVAVWRRGERLVPLALGALLLLLPAMTGYTGEMYAERYAAPLVAVVAVLAGAGVAALAGGPAATGPWRRAALGALPLLLAVLPVASLTAYYGQQSGAPNQVAMATADLLAPARGCIHVVLDQRLAGQVTSGGGTMARSLRLTLSLAGVGWETQRVHGQTLRDVERDTGIRERGGVVVAIFTPPTIQQLSPQLLARLQEIWRAPDGSGAAFTVYAYRAPGLPVCAPPAAPPPVTKEAAGDAG
jgi:4-amino-4-deoxy-L-arabinose transferase-like glycosyltransferase